MRSILHKATCQWPLPSSHLFCESPGVIRAPSCIFHHAGSCCWNSSVNGNSRRHDLNKLGLEFLHTAFIYFPSKGSYWKNKYPVHNLLKGSYCTQRQIIILLPYGWGQRGISFLTAIQCCLLAVVFLAVWSLCTARMGKTGFFQQSKIRFLWKSFHTSRQGRQQSWKKEGVGSRKKDPSNLSSWRKRPSSLSGQDKACKENKGKNKSTELAKLPTQRTTALWSECLLLPTNHTRAEDFPSKLMGQPFTALLKWSFRRTSGDTRPPPEKPKCLRYFEAVSGSVPNHKRTAYKRTAQKGYWYMNYI